MVGKDRRTERTRTALMHAFVDLVLAEGYDAVTVERVAARANVGRSTFYLHFRGREDTLRCSLAGPSSHLAVVVGHDVAPEGLLPILAHFHEQRKRNRVFFDWPIRPIWVKILAETIAPRVAAVARQVQARPLLPLPSIAAQIAEMQIALIVNWISGRAPPGPEMTAEALIAATGALLRALLRVKPDADLFLPRERLIHVNRAH